MPISDNVSLGINVRIFQPDLVNLYLRIVVTRYCKARCAAHAHCATAATWKFRT